MNSEADQSAEKGANNTCRLPSMALLRWLERWGLSLDYGRLRKRYSEDAWWADMRGEVSGPHGFGVLLDALLEGAGSVQYLHDSEAGNDRPLGKRCRIRLSG
jgi:hypothetical protein